MEELKSDNKKNKEIKPKKIWIDEHIPYRKRVCGSGLTFTGRYEFNETT